MNRHQLWLFLIQICGFFIQNSMQSRFLTYVESINFTCNPLILNCSDTIYMDPKSKFNYRLTLDFDVKKRVEVLKGRLRIWQGGVQATNLSDYRKFMDVSSMDICKVLGGAEQDLVVAYFMNLFGRYGKLPKCPIESQVVRFTNVTVTPQEIPYASQVIKNGKLLIKFEMFTKITKRFVQAVSLIATTGIQVY